MKKIEWTEARIVLLVSVALTVVLYAVPRGEILAYPFLLLSTVAHEMGHGLMALLVGGTFHRFEMWSDGSGVATWSGDVGRLGRALVAMGGLLGPAVVAAVGFAAGRTALGARICLQVGGAGLVVAEILVLRGVFGMFFVAVITALCILVAWKATAETAQLILVFLAVQLALSVFSRGEYLFTPSARTANGTMLSDVGFIADALFLPYWFWGGVCGAVSVLVLIYGLKVYWRR